MNNKQSIFESNGLIYFLAFLLGWCGYSLKLVSIIKLIGDLDFKFYPLLMLIQGISLFASIKLLTKISEKNEGLFYTISLGAGLCVVYLTNNGSVNLWAQQHYDWLYPFIVFILSSFIILAIDITTRLLVTGKISMLQEPRAAARVSFFGECGVILGASLTLALIHFSSLIPSFLEAIALSLPFIIALLCLTQVSKNEPYRPYKANNIIINQALEQHTNSLQESLRLYLPYLIAMISIVMICKQFQGFAVLVGIKNWQESSQHSISTLFSTLSLIQNTLIIVFLLPAFFGKSQSTIWSFGFKFFFYLQACSMFLIGVYSVPLTLLGTGVARKIAQRGLLGQSLNMLISSIPKAVRFEAKSKSQKWAHSVSYLFLAVFSYLAIFEYISFNLVWFIAGGLALVGIYLLRLLLKQLNHFHINNIKEFCACPFNVYEAISSCYSLANKDARIYHKDISEILDRKDNRSIFNKAMIHTLGEMNKKETVKHFIDIFYTTRREDIQLEILKTLSKFKHKEINVFFENVLTKTIFVDTDRGELKLSFCQIIAKRIPQESIATAQKIIEKYSQDKRVVANAIDVLGEVNKLTKSKKLDRYLAEFLSPQYPRRIRINAIKHLYHQEKYRKDIESIIYQAHQSERLEDRAGAAYLYGILGINEQVSFIQQLNEQTNKRNSTVLLSLLRLNIDGAAESFIELLKESNSEDVLIYINQLYRVRDDRSRYTVYFSLLNKYPENVSHILRSMKDSFKNFDHDRLIIIEEAERLGIKISDDLLYQIH
jgi:hypothetical protein